MIQLFRTFSQSRLIAYNGYAAVLARRNLFGSSETPPVPEGKNELIQLDPIELATGMYKKDILDKLDGNDDPYSVKMLPRVGGTKENPNMIPSAFESRMVGCVCEEDSNAIVWMWLHKGEPKRCQCGHWFQLFYKPTLEEKPGISI